MKKFELVATGGTFDIIHDGHIALLSESFSISQKVIIGLTSDELATRKQKTLVNNYSKRLETLENLIEKKFPNSNYQISKLDNDFGPAVLEGDVQALVTSEETQPQGDVLNKLRSEKNLSLVEIIVVPMVLAKDGKRISTSRIKNSEIDTEGNLS
ncbi:MAG: pantetheine-phosphate adenylyltransferase [Nitrosopumilaceae archaeon]|nr:pantetheine-phosphate adenylyltransferase [Nitrosopumilaceae archaeon]